MADTPRKLTLPGSVPSAASSLALSHPSELLRTPAAAAARAQDGVLSGFRVLLDHHTGGAVEPQVFSGTPSLIDSPDFVTWRTVTTAMETTTPGTVLVARCLSVPSGAQVFDDGGLTSVAVGGEARIVVTWHNEAAATSTITAALGLAPPSDAADGAANDAQGAGWSELAHSSVGVIRPPGAALLPATKVTWSEVNTVKLELQVRGGARLINVTVAEAPLDHAADHDDDAISVNGVASSLAWEGKIPQTSATDGATYEEHRYGVDQAQRAAERQTLVVGPAIARWGSWSDDTTLVTATDPAAKVIAASGATTGATPTMERVDAGTNVLWDATAPGHWIMSTGQEPDSRRQRGRGLVSYATVRVHARVHCRFATAGAGVGLVRWQSTPRSWIQLRPDRAVIGDTWTWLNLTGWLEANIATDDFYAIVQTFASRGTSTSNLEVRYFDLTYGWTPVYLGQ